MNDQIWYVYQNNQQLGPFATAQITQMLDTKVVVKEAYLFKVGWKDWRPVEDCYEELAMKRDNIPLATEERRSAAPRASIAGRIVVHNNGQIVIGQGVNISSTGIFVETKDQIFRVGEKLKLSVRVDGMIKAFNATALVIRFNGDPQYQTGFGLKFEEVDPEIVSEIEKFVSSINTRNLNVVKGQN